MSFDTSALKRFSATLRNLPKVTAQKIAAEAAPLLTAEARRTFAAGETPDGVGWDPGAEGQRVTLRRSGRLADTIRYVAIGTLLRMRLGTSYAKYQVGRRPVAPTQGSPLPKGYRAALAAAAKKVLDAEVAP